MVSKEFNDGFWCAVKSCCAEGCSDSALEGAIKSAGFSREEFEAMLAGDDYQDERLLPIVNGILSKRNEETINR